MTSQFVCRALFLLLILATTTTTTISYYSAFILLSRISINPSSVKSKDAQIGFYSIKYHFSVFFLIILQQRSCCLYYVLLYRYYYSAKRIVMLWVCLDILNCIAFGRIVPSATAGITVAWIAAETWGNKLLYLFMSCLLCELHRNRFLLLISSKSTDQKKIPNANVSGQSREVFFFT